MTCWPVASSHLPVSVANTLMSGYFSKDFSHTVHAGDVGRVSGEAFDLHDLALAAEFVGQPLRRCLRPFLLVDAHVVHAGHIQFLVHRDDDDALGDGFLQGGIQAVDITGVDQDGIHVLGHQVLQLLDLAGHIRVGAFDHQFSR